MRVDGRHCNIENGVCDHGCMFDVHGEWLLGDYCDVILRKR